MKIAELPDGTLMKFAPDYPDEEMDRAVRAKLGIPEAPDEGQMLMELMQNVMQQQAMVVQMLQQSQAQMQMLMTEVARGQQAMAQSQQASSTAIQQGLSDMARAFTQPRTIVKDGTGKPIGIKIGGN